MKKIFIFIVVFFLSCNSVGALTLKQLYNELDALEKSYEAAQKKANMSQAELNRVKASIANTEQEIRKAQNDITKAERDIIASEKEIEKKKDETDQMLLYLQLTSSSGNNMLEYIFEAEDYTEFIYRYSVVSQMSDYNQSLIEELNKSIETLNNKKVELSNQQKQLSSKKSDLESKYLIVKAQNKHEHDEGLEVADQISEKKKLIKHYKNQGCTMNQDVNNCSGLAAVDGWFYPLKSFYQSSAYAESRGYVKHYAVDLAAPEGNPVYAVANGVVLSAAASTCGGMTVQIKHSYHGSYYVSLYMHLIDSYVRIGSKVTGGQVIGTSGGGPREIAKWGDRCTEGAHLHFSMATGESPIRYSSELGSTFNPSRFFPGMKGIGTWYKG